MKTIRCRFPGCTHAPFGRTQDRGRHEAMEHKMKGGILPPWKRALEVRNAKRLARASAPSEQTGELPKVEVVEFQAPAEIFPENLGTAEMQVVTPEIISSLKERTRQHIRATIALLEKDQERMLKELDRLEGLRDGASEIAHQKDVLFETLDRLEKVPDLDTYKKTAEILTDHANLVTKEREN